MPIGGTGRSGGLGVDRHEGGPGLSHAEQRHVRVDRTLQQDGHPRAAHDAEGTQVVGQPVRVLVQLPVGQLLVAALECYGRWIFVAGGLEHVVQTPNSRDAALVAWPAGRIDDRRTDDDARFRIRPLWTTLRAAQMQPRTWTSRGNFHPHI